MVKTPANRRGTIPVTTGGRSSARPRSADTATKATASTPRSVKFDRVGDQDHGSDDDGSEDGLEMKDPRPLLDDGEVDELTMVVGKSGAPRPIARRLGSEFDEVAPARALAPDGRPTTGSRPSVNGDTPNAPIVSSGLTQLAEQTKRLLEAMGFECAAMPSKVALQIWELGDASAELTRWKRKLKDSFGVRSSTTVRKLVGVDPSRRINEDTDDDDDDDDYAGRDYADPCEDLAAQVRRSYHHEADDGAQRIKLTHHISLSKLSKLNGTRNRSERSLRWLKKFIYEMEGTKTPQDRWCELSSCAWKGVPATGYANSRRRLGRNGRGCARCSWPITARNTTSPPKIGTTQQSGTTMNTSATTCCG
ncbi:unnamed protein product [Phytophthora fragariaefolia]|uniref:Unnamed protein product n=1 Tax=Phytophthora fragariaefolia TaxID=1490495 RepID=A0A9W6YGK2_9STRA|nr:unnamed protein product [Phytophthora fragariaefolia]